MRIPSIANVLGYGLVLLLISGCASSPQRIEVSAKPVDRPELTLPTADKLDLRPIKWVIITEENYAEVVEDIRKNGNAVVFGLTDKGYENLSLNLADLRSYIQQQNIIIAAYENYYKNSEKAIDDANAQIEGAKEQVESQQPKQEKPIWKIW